MLQEKDTLSDKWQIFVVRFCRSLKQESPWFLIPSSICLTCHIGSMGNVVTLQFYSWQWIRKAGIVGEGHSTGIRVWPVKESVVLAKRSSRSAAVKLSSSKLMSHDHAWHGQRRQSRRFRRTLSRHLKVGWLQQQSLSERPSAESCWFDKDGTVETAVVRVGRWRSRIGSVLWIFRTKFYCVYW